MLVIYLGVIRLDSKFPLGSSSNGRDMDKFFSSIFGHQGGSDTTFRYPVMLGGSIQLFGPFECFNLSIINAMGYCSRLRKNSIEKNYRQRTDKPITETLLLTYGMPG